MASAARKAAEAFVTSGHVWDGPTCIRAVEIITALLAEQEAGYAMPDAVRAARDKARAVIDREGGPMTPWGLDMCAVLDSLDDWEREGPAPSPARDEVREAAEALLEDYDGVEDQLPPEIAEKVLRLRNALAGGPR